MNAFAVGRVEAEIRCRGDDVIEVSDSGTITRRNNESAGCAEEGLDAPVAERTEKTRRKKIMNSRVIVFP